MLLILAAVTITFVLGEDGLINKAKEAANSMNNAVANDQASLTNVGDTINGMINGVGGSGDTNTEPELPQKPEWKGPTGIQNETVKTEDGYGNMLTIPKGFEVVEQEGTTVPEGIVIQDKAGNQFVWIPVGRVYKDTTKNNYSDIQLGRYTFNKTNGTPTLVQAAYTDSNPKNYEQLISLNFDGCEMIEYATRSNPDGVESDGLNGLNAIAKDLAGFVNSVKNNGGYYLSRYEASYGSGSSVENYKPLSKVSIATRTSSSTALTEGMLWNFVAQKDATKISRNMYKNDSNVGVESDLVNSYAWDTAIVFIQEMGNTNYANKESVNSTLANTGTIGDKVCNIHDLASNCWEWSTEFSTSTGGSRAFPCVGRGGVFGRNTFYTVRRIDASVIGEGDHYLFRTILYVK